MRLYYEVKMNNDVQRRADTRRIQNPRHSVYHELSEVQLGANLLTCHMQIRISRIRDPRGDVILNQQSPPQTMYFS